MANDGGTAIEHHYPSAVAVAEDTASEQVVAHIERTGSWRVDGIVTDAWIARALTEARLHVLADEYEVILDHLESSPSSAVYEVANDPAIRDLLRSVVGAAAPQLNTDADSVRTQLRVVVGEDPLNRPLNFHYDRSVVTMVIPLLMPTGEPGASGELILVRNRRPFRRWVALNVVEKAIVQSRHFRSRFVRTLPADTVVVPLAVGNAYLFWGYRSYHTTLPCPANSERITVIMHFGEVHDGSRMIKLTKSTGRYWRLRRDSTVQVREIT